jgi:hypothetical protein
MQKQPNYSQYVEHPRYGRSPRYTGLHPDRNAPGVHLHWNTEIVSDAIPAHLRSTWGEWPPSWYSGDQPVCVPDTAIEADPLRQAPRPLPVTHYYDLDVLCRQCRRRFIFFAEEQKLWYEELQLPLESQAVRCTECRKQERWVANQKKRYDTLCSIVDRTPEQSVEMAECCLLLIEQTVFHPKQTQHVRQLLNSVPEDDRQTPRYQALRARVLTCETELAKTGSGY